ncbi:MAG: fumarylacetoacetate hydrolase family protein [Anaerolineae bacterium]|jgi:2-keto-4-pentenoate hydratase/2-oxohepta-3-ene-1,7-dioic acid hydratase in catechol pathway
MMTQDWPRWGVVTDDTIRALIGDPFGSWELGEGLGRVEAADLLAPTMPTKIVCVGLNYTAHADESSAEVPSEPLLFFKPPSAVIGPDASIVLPSQSERVDYEGELAIVIGRAQSGPCRHVSPDRAWDHVLGVTCGNDVTARDLQSRDNQWTRAKGFDTFCPLGPWLMTGLGEEDVAELEVVCRVNEDVRQDGHVSDMVFSPAELMAYVSSIMTLAPGDVIMTGTPEGVGPLAPGDKVEVRIEGVGELRNVAVGEGHTAKDMG